MSIVKRNKLLFIPAMIFRDFWGSKLNRYHLNKVLNKSLKELRKNGVCIISLNFDDSFLRKAIEEIEESIKDADIIGSDFRLFGAEKKFTTISKKFSHNTKLHNLASKYLYSDVILQSTLAAKLNYEEGNLGSGQGWHRDSYSKQFKSMLYLTDVDKDSGPFEYMIGSHRYRKIIKEIMIKKTNEKKVSYSRFSEQDVEFLKDKLSLNVVKFEAKKGSIILFDSRGIHRGSPIKKGSRYALTNYYVKKSHA